MMNPKFSCKINYVVLGLCLIIFVLSGLQFYSQKPMVLDGSRFLFSILKGNLLPDADFHRYSTLIWQIATGVIGYPFEGQVRHQVIVTLYNFFYSFHFVISLGICFFLLPKNQKNHLLFPALSYVLAILPVMSFPGSHVVEVASYFWPFVFILEYSQKNVRSILALFLFGLLVIFSYMQSVSLLYILALYFTVIKKQMDIKVKTLLLLIIIGTSFYIYKWFGFIDSGKKVQLFNQLLRIYNSKLYFIYVPTLIFLLQLVINIHKNIRKYNILFLLPYCLFVYINFRYINPLIYMGFYLRLLAVPVLILFVLVYLYWSKNGKILLERKGYMAYLLIPLLITSHFDYKTSKKVKKGFRNIEKYLNESKGCKYIEKKIFDDKMFRFGLSPDFLVIHSIILGGYEVNSILYSRTNGYWGKDDYAQINTCKSLTGKSLPIYIYENIQFGADFWDNSYLKFDQIESNLRSARRITYKTDMPNELGYIAFKTFEKTAEIVVKRNIKRLKLKYYGDAILTQLTMSSEDNLRNYKARVCDKSMICFENIPQGTYKLQVNLEEDKYILISEYYIE